MNRESRQQAKRKVETFAKQYVALNFNGKAAAIAAGYAKKSATVTAAKLLTNPNVKALVAKFSAPIEKKLDISVERTLKQIARHAFADPREAFNADGTLKNVAQLNEDIAACVAGFQQDGKKKTLRFTNQLHALEMLAKYHKLFAEDRTPVDMGVRIIVMDAPRPPRLVGAGAAALPAISTNGHKNGHKTPKDE